MQAKFQFDADSLDAAGREVYRLAEILEGSGFELTDAEVVPAPPGDDPGRKDYDPL